MAAELRVEALVAAIDAVAVHGDASVTVGGVAYDSRQVAPGDLFCCAPGSVADGHDFAAAAVDAGATALLVERVLPLAVTQIAVESVRSAMAVAAAMLFGNPSHDVTVVGVTGTNGKTTVTHLLGAILTAAGRRPAVLGTLSGPRTTPESPDLQRWLAARRDEGVDTVAMEVSSHALALHRVDATRFAVSVFTNLSRDHLDFHTTMEAYFEAKARLFTPALSERAVVNLDDPSGRLLRDAATIATAGFSIDDVDDLTLGRSGSSFTWRGEHIELSLGGRFNVANALAAAEAAILLGVEPDVVARGLSGPLAIPGRFELIEEGQPFTVIVDYAHTPDGLERVLDAAGEMAGAGRVHLVFGCGGDRDRTKRSAMGEVAALGADSVVLTADNSRSEDTAAIIGAVRQGFLQASERRARDLHIEPDRRDAIALALASAADADVVVVAGKGHESTQTIGDAVLPFDDREVARALLRTRPVDGDTDPDGGEGR